MSFVQVVDYLDFNRDELYKQGDDCQIRKEVKMFSEKGKL